MTSSEKAALDAARETIEEQKAFIDRLSEQASPYATVAYVDEKAAKVVLIMGGNMVEAAMPSNDLGVEAGETVVCVPQTGQILAKGITQLNGAAVRVTKVVSDTRVEVNQTNATKSVFKSPRLVLEEGDVVILDPSDAVVVSKTESAAVKFVRQAVRVTWDDVGGLQSVKDQMREIIELPHQNPEIFSYYGYTPPKGILLEGPPGCGKTMVGKAVANAIAEIHGGESGFIFVKGPEVLDKFVGEAESKIRSIFDQARKHKRENGTPAVVFIDEAEALLSRRGTGVSSDMEKTIVPTFLAEMDGLDEQAAIVILATNLAANLDPAVVRDGRIDRKITIPRPDRCTAREIAAINLSRVPCAEKDLDAVVADELFSAERVIYTVGSVGEMTLSGIVTGAMVANVVSRATGHALQRDLREKTQTGVTSADVRSAVDIVMEEAVKTDHSDEIKDFVKGRRLTAALAA